MNAENFTFDDSPNTQVVEHFRRVFPRVRISIFSNRLVIKPIYGSNLPRFVVSSQKGDIRRPLQLETEQKLECLDRVEASVDIVTHEDVTCVWDLASFVEKFEKVVELSMNISTNRNRRRHWLDIALLDQDLLDLLTEDPELPLWQNSTTLDSGEPLVDISGILYCSVFEILL